MIKPLHLLSPAEKAALVAQMKIDFAAEEFFPDVLGNRNSFFIAKPVRKTKVPARKLAQR